MNLSFQAINEFKSIYLKHFDIELSNDEVNIKGVELLEFFQHIYRQVPKEDEMFLKSLSN